MKAAAAAASWHRRKTSAAAEGNNGENDGISEEMISAWHGERRSGIGINGNDNVAYENNQ